MPWHHNMLRMQAALIHCLVTMMSVTKARWTLIRYLLDAVYM